MSMSLRLINGFIILNNIDTIDPAFKICISNNRTGIASLKKKRIKYKYQIGTHTYKTHDFLMRMTYDHVIICKYNMYIV